MMFGGRVSVWQEWITQSHAVMHTHRDNCARYQMFWSYWFVSKSKNQNPPPKKKKKKKNNNNKNRKNIKIKEERNKDKNLESLFDFVLNLKELAFSKHAFSSTSRKRLSK